MTETELIAGCIKENRSCQKALYDRFSGRMFSVCLRYTGGNRLNAEEVLQDGFLSVFDNINKFRKDSSLETWIRKIMINTALRYLMKTKLLGATFTSDNHEELDWNDHDDWNVLSRISVNEIMKMISELPAGYRTIFNLYAIDGYDHKEISEMLHINKTTSRSQLVKARNMLKQKIKSATTIIHHGS